MKFFQAELRRGNLWNMVIRLRWFSGHKLSNALIKALVPTGLLFAVVLPLEHRYRGTVPLYWWVGLGFAPLVVAISRMLFNVTELRLEGQFLVSHTVPLAFPWRKSVPIADVDQIFCVYENDLNLGRRWYRERMQLHQQRFCSLWAQLKSGHRVKLVADVVWDEEAMRIEEQLEQALGIKNFSVPGDSRDRF